ncbi:hypothetical protein K2X40_05190 [Candidatus Babeliales bacterium]|nr:hypothetical protein [Candidatus Babeliales bacterium]
MKLIKLLFSIIGFVAIALALHMLCVINKKQSKNIVKKEQSYHAHDLLAAIEKINASIELVAFKLQKNEPLNNESFEKLLKEIDDICHRAQKLNVANVIDYPYLNDIKEKVLLLKKNTGFTGVAEHVA